MPEPPRVYVVIVKLLSSEEMVLEAKERSTRTRPRHCFGLVFCSSFSSSIVFTILSTSSSGKNVSLASERITAMSKFLLVPSTVYYQHGGVETRGVVSV